ncbi:MAG: hypothetical protein MHMPM18_003199, partial [Marteilia pararefringens]
MHESSKQEIIKYLSSYSIHPIVNKTKSCYAISSLQCLAASPRFIEIINRHLKLACSSNKDTPILAFLSKVYKKDVNIMERTKILLNFISKLNHSEFKIGVQSDADEFLGYLLDKLNDELSQQDGQKAEIHHKAPIIAEVEDDMQIHNTDDSSVQWTPVGNKKSFVKNVGTRTVIPQLKSSLLQLFLGQIVYYVLDDKFSKFNQTYSPFFIMRLNMN